MRIRTPLLVGSLSLRGLQIDDLVLTAHRATAAKSSPPVRLLTPADQAGAYFVEFGWTGERGLVPGRDAVWKADRPTLAPHAPVTLSWDSGHGAVFLIRLSVDERYMFTIARRVENRGGEALSLSPYSVIIRRGRGGDTSTWTMHTGPIGTFRDHTDYSVGYADVERSAQTRSSIGGWIGFGDKYWLTALIPDQTIAWSGAFKDGNGTYDAEEVPASTRLRQGTALTSSERFLAGSKELSSLQAYEAQGIARFDGAIDWGWFVWFEKPLFYVLDYLFRLSGNFGIAIILLTLFVRLLLFPIAHKQFASMAAMRRLQPQIADLKERHKDDKARLQQEMLRLYSAEGASPFAGCLPIVLQMPIFFALYKVLMLSTEMRHQPFVLWLKDLSAPDPLTPINLFGLLPFNPPGALHVGVLALLLGFTMWLQMRLSPTAADPVQQQVNKFMPVIMVLVFSPLAAGLQLYYVANNVFSLLQQRMLVGSEAGERRGQSSVAVNRAA